MDYLMIAAVLCAYIVKGLCGFANTLVFSTILSFRTNNIDISPVELIVGYPANVIIAWKERKELRIKVWLPLSCLVILGSIPGAFILKNSNITSLKIIFGAVVMLAGAEMFLRGNQRKEAKSSPVLLGVIGTLSGVLCGLFGIGAFLAAYVGRTTDSNSSFRGNLCIVFLAENTFRIIIYLMTGILSFTIFKTAIILIPFMLAGLAIGNHLSGILDEKAVRKAVTVLLMLSGISLIIKNL